MKTIFDIFAQIDADCAKRKEQALKDYMQGKKDSQKGIYNDLYIYYREDIGNAYHLGWISQD